MARSPRILVIADELRELIGDPHDGGLDIHHETGLGPACQALGDESFDLVVLELPRPDGAGVEAVERIAAAAESAPVIVVADLDDDLALACMEAGAQDLLPRRDLSPAALRRQAGLAVRRRRGEEVRRRADLSARLAAVSQLAAGVAHEITDPAARVIANLGAMVGHVEELRSQVAGKAARTLAELEEMLADNLQGMERLRMIARDLQVFSRFESSIVELVDMNDLVDSACSMVQSELRGRATLIRDLTPVPAVEGDRSKLCQVLVNLLINAAHAVDGDEERDQIKVETLHRGGRVTIAVEDTGRGIAAEHLARIFEPFFTTKSGESGTGLGLSICAEIAASHGGDLTAHSEVGRGSRFELRLPAVVEVARPAAVSAADLRR